MPIFSKKTILILTIGLVLAAAGFYFLDFRNRGKSPENVNISLSKPDAISDYDIKKHEEKPLPTVILKEVAENTPSQNLPPYTGELVTTLNPDSKVVASVGAALVEKYQKDLSDAARRLTKNPGDVNGWLGVAHIKKLFNNYLGARDALEYAKIADPQNTVAQFNLGELYGYELGDAKKAEENYIAALKLNPYHLDYYVGLANFYEDVAKNLKKAEETLLSALDKIPHTEPNLFAVIGAFYRDGKDYKTAIEYFEKALAAALRPEEKEAVENELKYLRSKEQQSR